VLSYLYLASMVLKHHHDTGAPEADRPIVEWACRSLLYRAQEQLHDFLRNVPVPVLAGLMRVLIFPRGRTYFAPEDRLGAKLAALMLTPSDSRERLCRHAYRSAGGNNPLAALQQVLLLSAQAEPLERKLREQGLKTGRITALDVPGQIQQGLALGILTEAESQLLLDYDSQVMNIVNVDDFAPTDLGTHPYPQE
jgi:acyl-CoA dehydrogenase